MGGWQYPTPTDRPGFNPLGQEDSVEKLTALVLELLSPWEQEFGSSTFGSGLHERKDVVLTGNCDTLQVSESEGSWS